jgi:hypothetical protein
MTSPPTYNYHELRAVIATVREGMVDPAEFAELANLLADYTEATLDHDDELNVDHHPNVGPS